MDVGRGVYETNNQPNKSTFKYEQEVRFCLRVSKVESKEYETILGKRRPVFYYTGNKMFMIDALKKIQNESARIRKLTSLSSP